MAVTVSWSLADCPWVRSWSLPWFSAEPRSEQPVELSLSKPALHRAQPILGPPRATNTQNQRHPQPWILWARVCSSPGGQLSSVCGVWILAGDSKDSSHQSLSCIPWAKHHTHSPWPQFVPVLDFLHTFLCRKPAKVWKATRQQRKGTLDPVS